MIQMLIHLVENLLDCVSLTDVACILIDEIVEGLLLKLIALKDVIH